MSVLVVSLVFSVLTGLSATARSKIQPVKLVEQPLLQQTSFKMMELLQAGYTAVDFSKINTKYRPDQENIYYFITRSDPETAYPVILGAEDLLSATNFSPDRRTVLIVHGWKGEINTRFCVIITKAYLQAEDVNVIVLDWGAGARGDYISSVLNTVKSGESASRFMNWLQDVTGSAPSDWHFIGHSLGGHQVGVIGRHVNGKVAYITSLDPAMPLWMTNNQKLRATDSAYTEVIHTNAGMAGHPMPLGHVDIYPNGGNRQPGCDGQGCDHERSSGVYYLQTNSASPYAM